MAVIYRFRMWDIANDCFRTSQRWATKERIASMGAEAVGDGVEIDDALIGHEYEGMTERGFDPLPPSPYRMR